jgi:hypothetical protein
MNLHIRDRWFALCGVAFVATELVGTFVQMAKNDTHSLTWSSSSAAISRAFSHHATTTVWIGSYLEVLSMGFFLVFALWAARKLGGGLLGSIASGFAIANLAVSMVSLSLLDGAAYLAGNGLPLSTARTLVTVNGAAFITTWFLNAFYLLAITPLALAQHRRIIGWSAAAIAAITLVSVAADPNNIGQMSSLVVILWIAGTSIALARREPRPAPTPAVAV